MKLIINDTIDQQLWDSSLLAQPGAHFLQSWAWGEFQTSIGNKVWRIAVEADNTFVIQIQIIKQSLGLGQSLLYAPRASLTNKLISAMQLQEALGVLIPAIKELGANERCLFFRTDPPVTDSDPSTLSVLRSAGFVANPKKSIQPQYNQVLTLAGSPAQILKAAKPKTRYNISVAKRNLESGTLSLETAVTPETTEAFLQLLRETSSNQGFSAHSDNYFRKQISILSQHSMGQLLASRTNAEPAGWTAAIFIVTFGDTATYLHGASSNEHRNLMSPYLLHDAAITQAFRNGIRHYDLGGVHPSPKHKWSGITRFKQGFGGEMIKYIETQELPLNVSGYRVYRFINLFR